MKCRIVKADIGLDREATLTVTTADKPTLRDIIDNYKDVDIDVDIKKYRTKRSLNANSAAWVMITAIAKVLRTTKDAVYLTMLKRYGVYVDMMVQPQAVVKFLEENPTSEIIGNVTACGQTGVQIRLYYGSSTYNSEEFAVFLDGIISEAAEMGIPFISAEERNLLLSEWGK
jgi:hypothetical protein